MPTDWIDATEFAKTTLHLSITKLIVEVTEEAITYSFGETVENTFDSEEIQENVQEYNGQITEWGFDEYYAFSYDYKKTGNLESFTFVIISPTFVVAMVNSPLTTWSKKERRLRLI